MLSIGELAVRYDERRAGVCIDAIEGWLETCTLVGDELIRPPCDAVFTGTLEDGAPCIDDLECADTTGRGAFCEPTTNTCVPRALEGEVCLAIDCAKGLYCDLFAGVCSPLRTSGECQLISACGPGYACSPEAECIPKLEHGEACQLDLQCQGGVCDADAHCAPALSSAVVCGG